MELQVFVERTSDAGYRASAMTLSAEGATEDEALATLRSLLVHRFAAGAKVVSLTVPAPHPAMKHLSSLPIDDPAVQDYLATLAEIRRDANAEANPL